jgi:hypothetical protein
MSQKTEDRFSVVMENEGSTVRAVLGIICLLLTSALFIAGLWPFNFNPVNKVERLQNGNGIRFYGQGIIFSQKPLVMQKSASGNASITIELLVSPHKENRPMTSSILTLYDHEREQILIGQWKKELFIRIPRVPAENFLNQKLYLEIGIEDALEEDTTYLISITSEKRNTDIYMNGKLVKSFPHFSLIPDKRGLSGYLILGNSSLGTHPWNGTFLGLAIYDYTLTSKEVLDHYHVWQKSAQSFLSEEKMPVALYLFDEHGGDQIRDYSGSLNHLRMPENFHPLRRTVLGLPSKDLWLTHWNLMDITINILGFVPFGFFVTAWLRQVKNLPALRAYKLSILVGSCLSLAIELIQAYLPTRDSSLMDVFSNIMGTATGVLILEYALPIFHKIKGDAR